jgi:hypothetical protein
MKSCPWCNNEYPEEFFEEHHLNHIHEDDSEENRIIICVKCHKRHHRESGYDTIIVKKNSFVPKTLKEEMVSIERSVFLQEYRKYTEAKMKREMEKLYGGEKEKRKELLKYIEEDGNSTLNVYDRGFHYTKEDSMIKKE